MQNVLKENKLECCNVAWFRLQEAISKNEHERAFLNYKLLMYSYNDQIYKKEIKALLHYSFNEINEAVKLFVEIFYEYLQNKDYIKAMSIYFFLKNINSACMIHDQYIENNVFPHISYEKLWN